MPSWQGISVWGMQKYTYCYIKLGESVKEAREKAKLSQRRLAAMCNLHYNTINALENGRGRANIDTVFRVSDALDVDFVALLDHYYKNVPRGE